MRLAYLDESEHTDAYCITALIVSEESARSLTAALDDVVAAAADRHEQIVSPWAELHCHAMVAGREDWTGLKSVQSRVEVYADAMEAIGRSDASVYIRGADLDVFRSRYSTGTDVHATVLPWLLELVQQDAMKYDSSTLVIADEVARAQQYRDDVRSYQRGSTWGWRSMQLSRILDTLHFAPSKASRLLQAADLVAYTHKQIRHPPPSSRAAAVYEAGWNAISDRLRRASIWRGPG